MTAPARSASRSRRPLRAATALSALLLAALAPRLYAQVRVGIVDIRRAMAESAEGRAAGDVIRARFEQRQADLNTRMRALETLKRQLEHPTGPIPPARLQKLARDYQQRVMAAQQLSQQYTQEIQALEGELTKAILTKMQPVVREVGQSDNYQLIVDEATVLFAPAHLNLTDRVVQIYNTRYPVTARPDAGARPADAAVSGGGGGPAPTGGMDAGASTPAGPAGGADAGRRPGALPGLFFRRDGGG